MAREPPTYPITWPVAYAASDAIDVTRRIGSIPTMSVASGALIRESDDLLGQREP
jgi:hypothetical protein